MLAIREQLRESVSLERSVTGARVLVSRAQFREKSVRQMGEAVRQSLQWEYEHVTMCEYVT
eukprot:1140536-Pelagomonas_calceolata.AAC.9